MTPEQRSALRRIDRQFDAIRAMPPPIPARERYRHGIEDVGVGSYLRCAGHLYRVESIDEYREKGGQWFELECFGVTSGRTTYLEWEKDDEIEVCLNGAEVSLAQLGVSADQVEEMSDRESGRIAFDGRSYHYDDDYGATYFRGGRGEGEPVYFYDFETKDEKYCLSVEEWGDASSGFEYLAYTGEYLEPDAVEVVVLSGAGEGS